MCGGYTRVCVRCGLCGKVEPRPLGAGGECPVCGHLNAPDAAHCSECGARIPVPPGARCTSQREARGSGEPRGDKAIE